MQLSCSLLLVVSSGSNSTTGDCSLLGGNWYSAVSCFLALVNVSSVLSMHGVPEPEGKRFYSREFSRLHKANQSGNESIVAEVTPS